MSYYNNAGIIGNVFIHEPTLASTNSLATTLLSSKNRPKEGTVIYTDYQSEGVGQYGSKWYTEPHKAVTLSVILYPEFISPQEYFYFIIMTSLSVYETCKKYIHPQKLRVKWPNDIFVENRKLCGILLHSKIHAKQFNYMVLGIGVNLSSYVSYPHTVERLAFLDEGHKSIPSIHHIVRELCTHLNLYYTHLKKRNFTFLKESYLSVLYKYGEKIEFRDMKENKEMKGTIQGVNNRGQLVISACGKMISYDIKELQYPLYD